MAVAKFVQSEGGVREAILSPDGKFALTVTASRWDGTGIVFTNDVKLWDTKTGQLTRRRRDRAILWDVRTGKQGSVLGGHKGGALTVAFSRDGQTLLVGGGKHAGLWHLK